MYTPTNVPKVHVNVSSSLSALFTVIVFLKQLGLGTTQT